MLGVSMNIFLFCGSDDVCCKAISNGEETQIL
jgi:hypothetical protein